MPYVMRKRGAWYVILKVLGGKQTQVGKHRTVEQAQDHLTALRIAERGL
jgi:hypothetical protein